MHLVISWALIVLEVLAVMVVGICPLIIVHELGHWCVARKLGFKTPVFSIGFARPFLVVGKYWETEFRITPWLLGGFVVVPELESVSTTKVSEDGEPGAPMNEPAAIAETQAQSDSVVEAAAAEEHRQFPIWKRFLVAVAGVTVNMLLALVLTFFLYALAGVAKDTVKDTFITGLSTTNAIARNAGLKPGDVILSVDGHVVTAPADVVNDLSSHKVGSPAHMVIKRSDRVQGLYITPNGNGQIGIVIGAHVNRTYQRVGLLTAAYQSVTFNVDMLGKMAQGLGMMLHVVPLPKGMPAAATEVHGLIAIVQIAIMASAQGPYSFIMFLIIISVNLAVMNILPIPVLDGGYVMFLALEKLRGKPLSPKVQNLVLNIFFMLLIALALFAVYNDIAKPILR